MERDNLIRNQFSGNNYPRILFRTSGGTASKMELGLGHVYRCLNLANHFKKQNIFFLMEDYGGIKKVINQKTEKNITILKKNIGTDKDIKKTINVIQEKKIDIIIIDKFNLKLQYLQKIRPYAKTVVISDLNKINFNCDLVINGFIGFKNRIVKNIYGSRCLLGPKYQILNHKFSKKNFRVQKKYDLLVTVGGFDEKNITAIILESIIKFKPKLKTKIILGPATKNNARINTLKKSKPKNIQLVEMTKNMDKEILNSKYGICSGGITTYEFAAFGVPFAIICQVRHQLQTAKQWESKGFALNLGQLSAKTPKKIEKIFKIIQKDGLKKQKKLKINVDGFGGKRVSNEILNLI